MALEERVSRLEKWVAEHERQAQVQPLIKELAALETKKIFRTRISSHPASPELLAALEERCYSIRSLLRQHGVEPPF